MTMPSSDQTAWAPDEPGPTRLATLVAAVVDAVEQDTGRGPQDGPGVARRRDLVHFHARDVPLQVDPMGIEERRLIALHVDDIGEPGRGERQLELGVAAEADGDVLPFDGGEMVELGPDGVLGRREAEKVELAVHVGGLNLIRAHTREGHGDSGERLAVPVDRGSVKVSSLELRGDRGRQKPDEGCRERNLSERIYVHHSSTSFNPYPFLVLVEDSPSLHEAAGITSRVKKRCNRRKSKGRALPQTPVL
jgi:hypothetical protein